MRGPILVQLHRVIDGFVVDKDKATLKLAMLVPIKTKDPLVRTWKKLGPTLSLEARW